MNRLAEEKYWTEQNIGFWLEIQIPRIAIYILMSSLK